MKKISTVILLLFGVFFFTGCGQQSVNQKKLTYHNVEYGFQLTLTENWKDYKTKVTKYNDSVVIDFCASIKESKMETPTIPGYHCLFKIILSDAVSWDKNVELCKKDRSSSICDSIDREIGRNDKQVFYYGAAQDYGDEEKAAFDDIKKIIQSFQLIK